MVRVDVCVWMKSLGLISVRSIIEGINVRMIIRIDD